MWYDKRIFIYLLFKAGYNSRHYQLIISSVFRDGKESQSCGVLWIWKWGDVTNAKKRKSIIWFREQREWVLYLRINTYSSAALFELKPTSFWKIPGPRFRGSRDFTCHISTCSPNDHLTKWMDHRSLFGSYDHCLFGLSNLIGSIWVMSTKWSIVYSSLNVAIWNPEDGGN